MRLLENMGQAEYDLAISILSGGRRTERGRKKKCEGRRSSY